MRRIVALCLAILLLMTGCGGNDMKQASYTQISQEEAKRMMDEGGDILILDVREQEEYEEGHIPGAYLLPVGSIDAENAKTMIPDKDSVVLVYCRSGNRSRTASAALAELGYVNIYEFGGIITWPYEIVKAEK